MKTLLGSELAQYIKERQAKQVRALRQAWHTVPKLVILMTDNNQASEVFVRLKKTYGEDILIDVTVEHCEMDDVSTRILQLNDDESVHGIVVQLPLADVSKTDDIVASIAPEKDVDGLGPRAAYVSATVTAIDWLLAGYNVTLKGKQIAVVGLGRLVGAPLVKYWRAMDLRVDGYDETTDDLAGKLRAAEVIVSATGVPRLVTSDMVGVGAVVVDAGTASENGVLVGDVADDVRARGDLTITPVRGGVGPLTIAALFDHVIQAAQATVKAED